MIINFVQLFYGEGIKGPINRTKLIYIMVIN